MFRHSFVSFRVRKEMGNCLKGSTADDISLLRGSDGTRDSSSSDQLGPPPPYQVILSCLITKTVFIDFN